MDLSTKRRFDEAQQKRASMERVYHDKLRLLHELDKQREQTLADLGTSKWLSNTIGADDQRLVLERQAWVKRASEKATERGIIELAQANEWAKLKDAESNFPKMHDDQDFEIEFTAFEPKATGFSDSKGPAYKTPIDTEINGRNWTGRRFECFRGTSYEPIKLQHKLSPSKKSPTARKIAQHQTKVLNQHQDEKEFKVTEKSLHGPSNDSSKELLKSEHLRLLTELDKLKITNDLLIKNPTVGKVQQDYFLPMKSTHPNTNKPMPQRSPHGNSHLPVQRPKSKAADLDIDIFEQKPSQKSSKAYGTNVWERRKEEYFPQIEPEYLVEPCEPTTPPANRQLLKRSVEYDRFTEDDSDDSDLYDEVREGVSISGSCMRSFVYKYSENSSDLDDAEQLVEPIETESSKSTNLRPFQGRERSSRQKNEQYYTEMLSTPTNATKGIAPQIIPKAKDLLGDNILSQVKHNALPRNLTGMGETNSLRLKSQDLTTSNFSQILQSTDHLKPQLASHHHHHQSKIERPRPLSQSNGRASRSFAASNAMIETNTESIDSAELKSQVQGRPPAWEIYVKPEGASMRSASTKGKLKERSFNPDSPAADELKPPDQSKTRPAEAWDIGADTASKPLADAFMEKKRALASRFEQRDFKPKVSSEPKTKQELLHIRKQQLKAHNKPQVIEVETNVTPPNSKLLGRLVSGVRTKVSNRQVSKSEMKQLTARNYDNLPEVRAKRDEEAKKAEARKRLANAKEFEKVRAS